MMTKMGKGKMSTKPPMGKSGPNGKGGGTKTMAAPKPKGIKRGMKGY